MTEVSAVGKNERAVRCEVCFRRCRLEEGGTGACGARVCRGGRVVPAGYGLLTALALDPIEKKPLRRFFPGSRMKFQGPYRNGPLPLREGRVRRPAAERAGRMPERGGGTTPGKRRRGIGIRKAGSGGFR